VVDTHGHLVGSQVLAEVGQLLAKTVDHPGATLVRYGGDEYVAVLPGANSERALEVAEKIRLAILESVFLSTPGYDGRAPLNLQGHFTASVGVASYRECQFHSPLGDLAVRRQEFIRIADESMYTAKRLGKNRVHLGKEKASS
jgi:diguanylate cyclase (GGDEF)-like protein